MGNMQSDGVSGGVEGFFFSFDFFYAHHVVHCGINGKVMYINDGCR